jgi:SAM-dependent methyltransferase
MTSPWKGYASALDRFIEATLALSFEELHHDFLPFIPLAPGRVLDVGAGIGRDVSVFAERGHEVVAAEPCEELRLAGMRRYQSPRIRWLDDSLPCLETLDEAACFDFVLASGVWHHLDADEQTIAHRRIVHPLNPGGVFALTLRNGPAGVGTRVFPTDGQRFFVVVSWSPPYRSKRHGS